MLARTHVISMLDIASIFYSFGFNKVIRSLSLLHSSGAISMFSSDGSGIINIEGVTEFTENSAGTNGGITDVDTMASQTWASCVSTR